MFMYYFVMITVVLLLGVGGGGSTTTATTTTTAATPTTMVVLDDHLHPTADDVISSSSNKQIMTTTSVIKPLMSQLRGVSRLGSSCYPQPPLMLCCRYHCSCCRSASTTTMLATNNNNNNVESKVTSPGGTTTTTTANSTPADHEGGVTGGTTDEYGHTPADREGGATGGTTDDVENNEINDNSPIEQVRLTVPVTDDPTLPVVTFRTWILGPFFCIVSAFTLQFTSFRQNTAYIPPKFISLFLLPLGKLLAATLPTKSVRIPGTEWTFSMNPGPFNSKEHALITIFANAGSDYPYALDLFMLTKIFYRKNSSLWLALLLSLITQMTGYGFAGIFMKFLVSSSRMWWPLCLVDVATFRALHEVEVRPKGHLGSFQFILLVTVSSFAYSIIPTYFFPSIGALSVLCWVWKHSVLAQQIGSGRFGLGIGSFALDWGAISGLFGNPLAAPMFAIVNTMVGFILLLYIIAPISYWSNTYYAKRFPFSSYDLLDFDSQAYNTSRIVNEDLTINQKEYGNYSKIYLSTLSLYSNGFYFALVTATLTDFALFNMRDAWRQVKQSHKGGNDIPSDVHNRLMKKYSSVPQWWFSVILVSTVSLSIYIALGYVEQTQAPYWLVLLAYAQAFILILPFGVLQATTGQGFPLDLAYEIVIGYVYPGKPLANMVYKAYGMAATDHALTFISDFKLGHYMKIPPKSMFLIQTTGTILSCLTNFVTLWFVVSTVDNLCDVKKLSVGSPWTCPGHRLFFSKNIIWGLVGPSHVYAPHGLYSKIYYFFALGVIASLLAWILVRLFPKTKWVKLISVPMILGAPTYMPSVGAVNFWSSFMVALFFNYFVFRKYKKWWSKYNYLLSVGLDFGGTLMILATGLTLQPFGIYGVRWWGLDVQDHCPLAQCPTEPGMQVLGCPVY